MADFELAFPLVDGRCRPGSGLYVSHVSYRLPGGSPKRIQKYLGRKEPDPDTVIDDVTLRIPERIRGFIGGISVERLCDDVQQHRDPDKLQYERIAAVAFVRKGALKYIATRHQSSRRVNSGFGSINIDIAGSTPLEPTIVFPVTEREAVAYPVQQVYEAGAFTEPGKLFVVERGLEVIMEPTDLMLDKPPF